MMAGGDPESKVQNPADVLITKTEKKERPRAAKRAAQKAKEKGISGDLRNKLLEEQSNPFRKFRQFFYLAAAGSASIGGFIAASRVVAALTGVPGVQPLEETVPNVAIDFGVVAAGVGLWIWEDKRGQANMEVLKENSGIKNKLSSLEVEMADGTVSTLQQLQGAYRPVLLAGTASEVTRSINLASRVGNELKKNDMLLVPFFTDLDDDSGGWQAMKDSSADGMWDSFLARPQGAEAWKDWLLAEKAQVQQKNQEKSTNIDTKAFDKLLRVFVVRRDGKVGSRTVGPPAWPKLCATVAAQPDKDKYGTP
eukprot:CAMPEP_0173421642 /NCGR_PEP_ID=MMETSP1357-20121228/2680_1 /TAXON_ID=77926 /ORGANISM="Hemiselmis rufescens, Strain PCC563" /LENGTH=308 /DNA_ID=CAMNT_0014384583 /DNA_START=241 /DNA_END=1167 /DNA_ORIENTATION=-